MAITITVQQQRVEAALKAPASPAVLREMLTALGRSIRTRVQLGFRTATAPNGTKWAPLKFRKGTPLVDTGRLRSSIGYRVEGSEVVVGTNLLYAPVHQFGAVIKPKTKPFLAWQSGGRWFFAKQVKVPARPFLPLTQAGAVDLPAPWAASALSAMAQALAKATAS